MPPKILANFRSKYKKEPLKKPPIVNGLEPITIFVRREDEEDDRSEESPQPLRKLRKILDKQPLMRPKRIMSMPNFTPPPSSLELTSMASAGLASAAKKQEEIVTDMATNLVTTTATRVVEGGVLGYGQPH